MNRRRWPNPRIPRCVNLVSCRFFLPGPEACASPHSHRGFLLGRRAAEGPLTSAFRDPRQTKWMGATQAPGPHLPPHQVAAASTATVSTATISMATVATATPSCLPSRLPLLPLCGSLSQTPPPAPDVSVSTAHVRVIGSGNSIGHSSLGGQKWRPTLCHGDWPARRLADPFSGGRGGKVMWYRGLCHQRTVGSMCLSLSQRPPTVPT